MYKFKRIFAVFLSVLLLSLTVGNAFISTNDISRVQATGAEFVAGAAAADAVLEFIMALLASIGAGEVAVLHKEAVAQGFADYLATPGVVNQMLSENALRLYKTTASAAGSIQSILWDDFLESLQNYHDSAVDTLTGIYAQYCPELIGLAKDFVADVAAKNITIAGVTDSFATPMTEETVAQQWSGEPYTYTSCVNFYSISSDGKTYYEIYENSGISKIPVCSYIYEPAHGEVNFFYLTIDSTGKVSNYEMHGTETFNNSFDDVITRNYDSYYVRKTSVSSFSYAINYPVFSSRIEAEAYLKGTGAVTDALNYSTDITDTIIDNNDLPTIGDFAGEIWERVSDIIDFGANAGVSDWADDIPWVGLDDLQSLVDSVEDVYDKVIEGILDGTFDLPLDIPDYSYGDAWVDVIDGTWDDIIDNPLNDPTTDKPITGDKDDPIAGDKDTTLDIDIPAGDLVPTINDSLGDIAGDLKYKFPFSIPWDVRHVFQILADTPKAPRFELPLVIKRFGIDERIIVDMAMFQVLSNLSRSLFSMLFGMYLMNLTFKVVSMRKEE